MFPFGLQNKFHGKYSISVETQASWTDFIDFPERYETRAVSINKQSVLSKDWF